MDEPPVKKVLALAGGVLVLAVLVGRCGGGGGRGGGVTNLDAETQRMYARLQVSQGQPFRGTYRATTADGKLNGALVTYEQSPPKLVYRAGDSIYVYDGSSAVSCLPGLDTTMPDAVACQLTPGAAPGQGVAPGQVLFTAGVALDAFNRVGLSGHATITHETKTVAGASADCARVNGFADGRNQNVELCATPDGFVGYWDDGKGDTFELTASSALPDARDFNLPATPLTEQQLRDKRLQFDATSTTTIPCPTTSSTTTPSSTSKPTTSTTRSSRSTTTSTTICPSTSGGTTSTTRRRSTTTTRKATTSTTKTTQVQTTFTFPTT